MQVEAEAWIARDVQEQLGALYMRETLPFQDMIMTYMSLLENFRDLQVRCTTTPTSHRHAHVLLDTATSTPRCM
jgi:hypothetical protein